MFSVAYLEYHMKLTIEGVINMSVMLSSTLEFNSNL